MKQFTDQLQRTLQLENFPPQRIVSLVPSQTELLFDLGLEERVVGITKFCIHPKTWHQSKARVGGTKNIDFEKIAALKPDLIIGNKEENDEAQIKALMELYPVWMSDINTLESSLEMIQMIGDLTATEQKSNALLADLSEAFLKLKVEHPPKRKRVAYIIWNSPIMAAGGDTFIHDMLQRCGWENVFESVADAGNSTPRYPEIAPEQLQAANPDLILLSSEPFPFKIQHIHHFEKLCGHSEVLLVDGEAFSWYGSRLLHSPDYFLTLMREIDNSVV